MFIMRAMCRLTYITIVALCSSVTLQKYLEWWPAALYEAGRSVLMSMKGPKIPRIELNTVHLYQYYSLFMHNKLQYIWKNSTNYRTIISISYTTTCRNEKSWCL